MLGFLDRMLIYNYIKSYIVCLVSLMGLFIVVDLFTNLDDFTHQHRPMQESFKHILLYYGNLSPRIFDRLCEAIVLLAAMFTVAMMQRNNELLPLLSAGVSTRRVVVPVLLSACAMLGTSSANQELVLPNIDAFLVEHRSDYEGDKKIDVKAVLDSNHIRISGFEADKKNQTVSKFCCTIPPTLGLDAWVGLQAEMAQYVPREDGVKHSGGWLLMHATPADLDRNWPRPDVVEPIPDHEGRYFLYTDIDFQSVIRSKNWFVYMTTWQLLSEMDRPGNPQQAALAVVFHQRLTRPILGMTLVIMGLGVILRDQTRNIFISAGMCLVLCALFFAACLTCTYLGNNEHLAPALAAWLPVLVFGPLAFVMFDAVHT
jgi:lipopolysaccharide export system permease protein